MTILTFRHIQCLHLMYAEVAWVLVSSGTQVQPQIIIDPDYLPDYFPFLITMATSINCPTERFSKVACSKSLNRLLLLKTNSSAVRQKGKSQNRYYMKAKYAKFSEKQTFLTPSYAHVRVRISGRSKKCSFFRKFGVFCFLITPVLRFTLSEILHKLFNPILPSVYKIVKHRFKILEAQNF